MAATSLALWRRRRNVSAATVKLPTGYRIVFAGEFEWLQQAKKRLLTILPVTFVLILVLLYGLFNSLAR